MEKLKIPLGASGAMESHFTVQRLFELQFGLFDHTNRNLVQNDPLAVIRAKKQESFSEVSHLDDLAENFAKAKIKDRFDLDFIRYIDLPIPMANALNRIAFEVMAPIEIEAMKRENDAKQAVIKERTDAAEREKSQTPKKE